MHINTLDEYKPKSRRSVPYKKEIMVNQKILKIKSPMFEKYLIKGINFTYQMMRFDDLRFKI